MKQHHHTIIALTLALPSPWVVAQTVTDDATTAYQQLQQPKNYNISAGTLTQTLNRFAQQTGVVLVFDPMQTEGKTSKGISGKFTPQSGFAELLKGSGLQIISNDKGGYTLKKLPPPIVKDKTPNLGAKTESMQLDAVQVRAKRFYEVGPMPGLALTKEEIPGNVQSISAKEIKESHALSLTDLMNSKLQSVSVNDYQGNPFQMDVNYRGFTASPQLGTAQGISVFLDGIRVNEPFGDVVNWDMIPMNALSSLDIFPGSNPIFGLGTLGGALSMRTKSGFTEPGLDAEILAGSYGRKQLQISAGGNNGVIAGFASGNFFLEDGWRDNSPSKVNQIFGKAEWRNEQVQLGLSMLYAGNKLTGNGLLPEQMAAENRSQVYTSPDESKNDLLQFQLSGIWDVTDTFNVTGQVYHRNSKRKSKTTDVNENFEGYATDRATGKQVLLGFSDINKDGLPDYNSFAINVAADAAGNPLKADGSICLAGETCAVGTDFGTRAAVGQATITNANGETIQRWTMDPSVASSGALFDFSTPATTLGIGEYNNALPAEYYRFALHQWQNKITQTFATNSLTQPNYGNTNLGTDENGSQFQFNNSYFVDALNRYVADPYYTDSNGFIHKITVLQQVNDALRDTSDYAFVSVPTGSAPYLVRLDNNSMPISRDGGQILNPILNNDRGDGTGFIEGTPTALITETEIGQVGTGGALQLNWNLDKHKLMLGGSVDMADSTYNSKEYLGILDNQRNGKAAPDQLGYEFYARDAEHAIGLNDFKGDSITKSLYASETWRPIEKLSITGAARYNYTTVKNKLDVTNLSKFGLGATSFINIIDLMALCTGADTNGDGLVDADQCPTGVDSGIVPVTPELLNGLGVIEPGPKEKFTYRSFNPALGATWQANETLNLYGSWNRGARTPTVIELGCAFDDSLVQIGTTPSGDPILQQRSLADRRSCNLPSTMSGDPYLKQVRSETIEFGARGLWSPNLEWNASIYKTDLTDDIYFVSVSPTRSFFQNIGDTKRQGLEMGLKGKWDKVSFGVNYALTDATFQSVFSLDSPHNSSAGSDTTDVKTELVNGQIIQTSNYGKIQVEKGNRMPGIPLHNLNFNFAYDVTDKWRIGLNAVMHSGAFVRGNENNKHHAGPATPIKTLCTDLAGVTSPCLLPRADFIEGKTAGYTVFNLQSSYKFTPEWTLGLQINNLFDKQYASAGRLGLNAFSPATLGVVGASGFNYNSSEWQGTSFLGTGAPRSAFITLSYQFVPDKK